MTRTTVAQICLTVTTAENPTIAGAWVSAAIHKNFTQAIRLDSIKRRKPRLWCDATAASRDALWATPQGANTRESIGGLGEHPLRVAHLAETNDATGLRLAVIIRPRLSKEPQSTGLRVGVPASQSCLPRRLQHHCSRGCLRRGRRGIKTRAPCLALGADLSRSTRSFLPTRRPSSGSRRCCLRSSCSRPLP
jgi:hypothetical protein